MSKCECGTKSILDSMMNAMGYFKVEKECGGDKILEQELPNGKLDLSEIKRPVKKGKQA